MSATPPPDASPGTKRTTGRGHINSFGDGRVCAVVGCRTRLSRYNSAARCWQHEMNAVYTPGSGGR